MNGLPEPLRNCRPLETMARAQLKVCERMGERGTFAIPPPAHLPFVVQEGVHQYAKRTGLLHPAIMAVLQRFFPDYDLIGVRVKIRPKAWLPFRLSGRGSPTPAFVVGETLYCREGWLNGPGGTGSENANFNTSFGWSLLAHELFHCFQGRRDGRMSMWYQYLAGVAVSVVKARKLWSHEHVQMEKEAGTFQAGVKLVIARWPETFWDLCREIRQ